MRTTNKISQNRLKELFEYQNDGYLTNKTKERKRSKTCKLYRCKSVDGVLYHEHRLIFLYHYGYLPELVDHIDQNPTNNKIENLRACTRAQNGANRPARTRNTSGYKGVYWHKQKNVWTVEIITDYKKTFLGLYTELGDAAMVYNEAAYGWFGEFAGLNVSQLNYGDINA